MTTVMAHFDDRRRRRRGWGQLWQTPSFVLGLIALVVVAATASLRVDPTGGLSRHLRQLRQTLVDDSPLPDFAEVEPLLERAEGHPRYHGEAAYLIGTYCYLRGERESAGTEPANEWFQKANTHLTRALSLGVGDLDLGPMFHRLGMAQYRLGENPGQALNWIRQGLELGAEEPVRGFGFLVEAYLSMQPANLNAALAASQKHLQYVDDRDAESLGKARFLHADILYRLDRKSEALHELDQIDAGVSRSLLAKVRFLQAVASEDEGRFGSALKYWRELEPLSDQVPGGLGRIYYSQGVAQIRLDPPEYAIAESLWKKALEAEGRETAQAAGIRLGHALLFGARYEPDQALKIWTEALSDIRVSSDYKNSYLDSARVLDLFEQACGHFLEKRDFPRSQVLTGLFTRLAPPGAAEAKIGHAYLTWARELSAQAERTPESSEELLREARTRYQEAGDYFKQASLSRESADKGELYWQSSLCYLLAGDSANAIVTLEKYVQLAKTEAERAQGHFALADTYDTQGQKGKAREHYHKCIELNASPFAVRALLKLAMIEVEARKLDVARDILVQIVNRNGPDMERAILEKTLYQLGQVLFDLGQNDEGAVRFREAVRRFPNNPVAMAVREKLADHAWEKARDIPVNNAVGVPSERQPFFEAMKQKRRAHLLEALDAYQALDREFKERFRAQKLSMDELLLWRKALFSIGDIRIDLDEFTEAMTYFRGLQQLYRGKAESLFAARQIYFCWRQLLRSPDERPLYHQLALEAITTALRDLDEIPSDRDEDIFLNGPNPVSREQWRRFLTAWQGELQNVTLRVNPRAFAPQE